MYPTTDTTTKKETKTNKISKEKTLTHPTNPPHLTRIKLLSTVQLKSK
jgi:hypothetical protein